MSIWNKVLLGLVGVASLALFYLAARTLKTHQYWRDLAQHFEARIDEVQKDTYKVREGVAPDGGQAEPGIRQVRRDLTQLLVDRGRVWHNCAAKLVKVSKDTGSVDVSIVADPNNPDSLASKGNLVVYAFEEAGAQNGGRYLGEFRVTMGADKQPLLQPTMRLTPREVDRLGTTKGPWILYEGMPHDNHRVFADWTAEQMKTVLPAGVVAEYVKDGKPAAQGDPAPRLSNGNYVRALRDYRTLFHADRVNWTEMLDLFQATTLDKALVDSALADAKRQEEADKQHVAEAKEKLGKYTREYDIVEAHRKTLERQLAVVTAEVAKLLEANKATADQLARSQWDAVHHIDQRVRDMVQSNAGGK